MYNWDTHLPAKVLEVFVACDNRYRKYDGYISLLVAVMVTEELIS